MGTPNSPYITFVVISGVLSTLLGLYAYFKKSNFSGIRIFMLLCFTTAIYTFAFAFELTSDSLEEIKRWVNVEYTGMPFIPPLSLILVMHYIGLEKYLTRKLVGLLFIIPALTLLFVTTNDTHHLFYRSIYLRPDTATPMIDIIAGKWYLVNGAFAFACMSTGVYLLLRQWNRTKSSYRIQLLTLLAGLLIPTIFSILYLVGLTPNGMDPVPIVMCVTSALYMWSILSTDMFAIVPIAKENIFESMRDGVLVLDSADRLVDYNRAAKRMIPRLNEFAIGSSINKIWNEITGSDFPVLNQDYIDQKQLEIKWSHKGAEYYYQIRSSIVSKPNGQEIGRMIVWIDVTEQKLLHDRLRQLAYYDGLTQIYSRMQFLNQSKELMDQTKLMGQPISFILFDIDHFKSINDNYGHDTGDQAIRHMVSICRNLLRPVDLFGRYGGEEFVLCLPAITLQQAGRIADRIRREIESTPLMNSNGSITITASFGVVQASTSGDTLESLLKEADQAMYASKRNGRNTVFLSSGQVLSKFEISPEEVTK